MWCGISSATHLRQRISIRKPVIHIPLRPDRWNISVPSSPARFPMVIIRTSPKSDSSPCASPLLPLCADSRWTRLCCLSTVAKVSTEHITEASADRIIAKETSVSSSISGPCVAFPAVACFTRAEASMSCRIPVTNGRRLKRSCRRFCDVWNQDRTTSIIADNHKS